MSHRMSAEHPQAHLGSSLYGESRHGTVHEKRGSVAEVFAKLKYMK